MSNGEAVTILLKEALCIKMAHTGKCDRNCLKCKYFDKPDDIYKALSMAIFVLLSED